MIKASIAIQRQLFYVRTFSAPEGEPTINPFFKDVLQKMDCRGQIFEIVRREQCVQNTSDGVNMLKKSDHLFHAEVELCLDFEVQMVKMAAGSWRGMFIANPPCPVHFFEPGGDEHRSECTALRMGELADCMMECTKQAWREVTENWEVDEDGPFGIDLIENVYLDRKNKKAAEAAVDDGSGEDEGAC